MNESILVWHSPSEIFSKKHLWNETGIPKWQFLQLVTCFLYGCFPFLFSVSVDTVIVVDPDASGGSQTESAGVAQVGGGGEEEEKQVADADRNAMTSLAEDLEAEEYYLWQTIVQVARSCSMIPLGQDRIHR